MTNFCEVPLAHITSNPKNPRKNFEGKKFDELVASIRKKGVIEPIIARPINGKEARYEVVAGERRLRAARIVGLETIPAIVRDLSDDEAYDFMLIENLQREDLTEREEAESFKAYISRHGEEAIPDLAEKTGISQGYIRSRVRILELPARVLKAWGEGNLCFGHLHQLLRVQDEPGLEEAIKWIFDRMQWGDGATVKELRGYIDDRAPAFSGAFFKAKDVCAACHSSSAVQKDLFDVETKGIRCLNPACFKKLQAEWLAANWKSTAIAKREGTNGFRFYEDHGRDDIYNFYDWDKQRLGKKCTSCPEFVSVIEISGKVYHGKACAGKKTCYDTIKNPKSGKEKATGERDPEAPRAAWHGEYFRDVFLCKRIPEVLAGIDPDDPKVKALLLVCAVHGNQSDINVQNPAGLLDKPAAELRKAFKAVVEKIILSGQHVGGWGGFGTKGRRRVAEYIGIDLAKEFAVTEEYLQKKTKAEIIAFGKKFRIFSDLNVAAHVARTIGKTPGNVVVADFNSLKKTELVDVVLKSGVNLVGKTPAEILK